MRTECITKDIVFDSLGKLKVIGDFDGGRIGSDGGGVLLREASEAVGHIEVVFRVFCRSPETEMVKLFRTRCSRSF